MARTLAVVSSGLGRVKAAQVLDRTAELAASALSNREIAETLWVTQKPVEVHLSHTYAKLGIPTRGQQSGVLAPEASAA
jgi:DNA-binding CsgD family transcriptional regulator